MKSPSVWPGGAFALAISVSTSAAAEPPAVQYRPVELAFEASSAPPQPALVRFAAAFAGPGGARYDVPGFWDGGSTWKVRFNPPAPGAWSYETRVETGGDRVTKSLFESGPMRGGEAAKRVSVDVRGAESIELLVTDGDDNTNWDHADWADARLVRADGTAVLLGALTPVSAVQGHGTLAVDKNLVGAPLKIADRAFERGLGTHAAGRIVYEPGDGFERFEAWVGLDAVTGTNGTASFAVKARVKTAGAVPEGLAGRRGQLMAKPASGDNPLDRHGGILRVSENKRYLTYADGTPFFWLGDTWWFCPSDLVPFEGSTKPGCGSMFKALVDKRRSQGFSVVQMAFLGHLGKSRGVNSFISLRDSRTLDVGYWREVDRYMDYANGAGLVPVVGMAFHVGMDANALEDWTFLWRYVVARYGAHAVSWLICGEYNQNGGDTAGRVVKTMALGAFIKGVDPYRRAMTVHPWWHGGDKRQAWDQPWYDFIMFQGAHAGHGNIPPTAIYADAWRRQPPRPVLEAECNYEGIYAGQPGREHTADDVRRVAYHAIQAGSFGYTYGAHGLWYPTQDAGDKTFSDWGAPVPWWEALERPGAAQLTHLRALYESVSWWTLEPRPGAVELAAAVQDATRPLAKSDGDRLHVVWFPQGSGAKAAASLRLVAERGAGRYAATWFDPRTGRRAKLAAPVDAAGGSCLLPPRPDEGDWVLVLDGR